MQFVALIAACEMYRTMRVICGFPSPEKPFPRQRGSQVTLKASANKRTTRRMRNARDWLIKGWGGPPLDIKIF